MLNFEDHWYRPHPSFLVKTLLPLSWLYQLIVKFRRFLYQIKLIKSIRFNILIIVVGNITVGGTGKTPLVIWLAHFLKAHGFKPGIVSRGVGGEQQYAPRWVSEKMSPKLVGDEAILLARRSLCPVVIGINRVAAVNFLLEKSDCDIVLSDDGLQHYRLGRQIEVAILDGERGLGNKKFLPAGPLRESPQRLDEVDFLVTHGKANSAKFSMKLKCEKLVSLKNEDQMHTFDYFQHKTIHGVAAIGNPQRFFNSLRMLEYNVIEHIFPDHYLYSEDDFNFGDNFPIIMTEKDAVKCRDFADERFWYLPVKAEVSNDLGDKLLKKLSSLSLNNKCILY